MPAPASLTDLLLAALRDDRLCAMVTLLGEERLGRKLLVFPEEPFPQRAGADDRTPATDQAPAVRGDLGSDELRVAATMAARAAMAGDGAGTVTLASAGLEVEAFVEVFAPPPSLFVVGAVHVAIHLVSFARELGFRTVVIDPRQAFATRERFPHADELLLRWPAEAIAERRLNHGSYFTFLSHDQKLDLPALELALRSPARYIGALGSQKTHGKRLAALRERGFSEAELARIRAPIGLKLGGRRPEEIALGIAAQLLQARYGVA